MKIILIIISLIPLICSSQNNPDSKIYSLILSEQLSSWEMDLDTISHIVITDNLTKFSKEHGTSLDFLSEGDNYYAYQLSGYNEKMVRFIKNNEFDTLIYRYNQVINEDANFESEQFKLKVPVLILDHSKIEKLFSRRNLEGSWRKFYRKNPTSPGYFEFSKIAYTENYAIVYFVHRAKPLIGFGGLEILIKDNDEWTSYAYINLWNN